MPVKNRIDLTNIEGSMTNIIHNNADRLYTAQSVRELYNTLLSIFRENNLDTKASRTLLTRVIEKHTVKQGLDAIFNSYFCGANMGREKEKVGEKLTMFKFDEKLKKIVEVTINESEITVETKRKLNYYFGKMLDQWEDLECQGFSDKDEIISAAISDLNLDSDIDEDDKEAYDKLWEEVAELFWNFQADYDKIVESKEMVAEDIEKIEVTTNDSEITVETEGEAVKVEIEPKTAECVDCEISDESSTDLADYEFFSDLNPETDIDDIEINIDDSVDSNTEDSDNVEESKSIKESNDINPDIWKAIGRKFDYTIAEKAAEILENLADRALGQDNVEDTYEAVTRAIDDGLFYSADIWEINALYDECQLSDNAYSCLIEDLVEIVENVKSGNLTEGIEKKYVKPLKDKINACYTKQDLDEIGAYLDDFSDKDIDRILNGKVSNKDINKMFGGYNFVDDDFPGWDFKESRHVKEGALVEYTTDNKFSNSSFDQAELKACLARVNANAAEYASKAEIDANYGSICVKLSEEDLKKALRIGSRGGYANGDGVTMPAQLVELVSLEITRAADEEDGICICLVELYGENEKTGESTHEYNNEDVPFVGDTTIPGTPIDSDEEFIEYIKTEVFPNADRIAHDIINETWDKFGFNDYEGITDYGYDTGITGYDEEKVDDNDDWSKLLKQADSLLGDLAKASGNADYDDGDGYWQTEYDVWCFRYLYHFRMLNNVAKVEQLCNEYSKKLPNVEFYFSVPEDGDDEVCEIGYTATKTINESKSIKESLSVAEFIDWHETTNYKDNENTFEAVYSILDKYPDSEDDVKAQYTAASDEDKEAISRIIDKANETATEEPTVYLARAMHKMYVDGYNYQEIADTLGAPVSLVIKMIGSDSYDESLTESTEDKLAESIDIEQYRTPEWERYETVKSYTVYLPTPKGKQAISIGIEEYEDGQYQAFCNAEGDEIDFYKFDDYLTKNHYYNWNVLRDDADDCLEDVETLIDDFVSMDEDDISKLLK